jgi:FkbM family methyltransferase
MSKLLTLLLSVINFFFKKITIEKVYKKLYIEKHNIYVRIKGSLYSFIYRSVDYDDLNMMCRENLKYWESSSREIFSKLSLTSNCAIDIGSYTGIYTLVAAKTNKQIATISFEPNPELFVVLAKNIKLNRVKNSKLEQIALDKEIGSATLYLNHDHYTSIGSLIKSSSEGKQISVQKVTLDKYCEDHQVKAINLMKIDVEGNEINILEGAQLTISKFTPIILMEALSTSALESQFVFLNKFNYLRPIRVKGDGYDKNNWLWFTALDSMRIDSVRHLLNTEE